MSTDPIDRPKRTSPRRRGVDGLTPHQRSAATVLAVGGTDEQAAHSAGCSLVTLRRWRREDVAFRAAVDEMGRNISERVLGRFRGAALLALETLIAIMRDPEASRADLIRASSVVLGRVNISAVADDLAAGISAARDDALSGPSRPELTPDVMAALMAEQTRLRPAPASEGTSEDDASEDEVLIGEVIPSDHREAGHDRPMLALGAAPAASPQRARVFSPDAAQAGAR